MKGLSELNETNYITIKIKGDSINVKLSTVTVPLKFKLFDGINFKSFKPTLVAQMNKWYHQLTNVLNMRATFFRRVAHPTFIVQNVLKVASARK